jgi:hypothetical protein
MLLLRTVCFFVKWTLLKMIASITAHFRSNLVFLMRQCLKTGKTNTSCLLQRINTIRKGSLKVNLWALKGPECSATF